MTYLDIHEQNYALFHDLANDYYREGEDADTPRMRSMHLSAFSFRRSLIRNSADVLLKTTIPRLVLPFGQ